MIEGILIILGGAILAKSLITNAIAKSEGVFEKMVPFQGYFGVLMLAWGIWGIIATLTHTSWMSLGGSFVLWWITSLVCAVAKIALGAVLGYGLISQRLLSKSEEGKQKAEETVAKLQSFGTPVGAAAMAIGLWEVIFHLFIF